MSLRKKLLDTFGAQVSSDHERYPADVKCLGFLYLYVGRYPRNNASRNSHGLPHRACRDRKYPWRHAHRGGEACHFIRHKPLHVKPMISYRPPSAILRKNDEVTIL